LDGAKSGSRFHQRYGRERFKPGLIIRRCKLGIL
jgi:hypothetical protein